jgi:hypothetical protein
MDDSPIPWHPAFFVAIQLELEQYTHALSFMSEYQLTTEPLRIDVLIIKKEKDIVIEKNFASIFRQENLVEYKSPTDYVSVEDFYKVYGYACLYASLNKRPVTDLTVTFVESRYPRELLAHLRDVRGYHIDEKWPGIYHVSGDILPIQIINCKSLSGADALWLANLTNDLDIAGIQHISTEINRQGKAARIGAYLEAIYKANLTIMTEALKMSDTALTLDKVLEDSGLTAKWEARGEERGVVMFEELGSELG